MTIVEADSRWLLGGLRIVAAEAGADVELPRPASWVLLLEGDADLVANSGATRLDAGDAVYLHESEGTGLRARSAARFAIAALQLAWATPTPPLPLINRGFLAVNLGISALVQACPIPAIERMDRFGESYGQLIGAAMHGHWLRNAGTPIEPVNDTAVSIAVDAISAHPEHDWTLDKLARISHLGRSALRERFVAAVGMPPMQYVRTMRMREARAMLERGDQSVTQVAFAVGYSSVSAFSRAFTSSTGMTAQCWQLQDRPCLQARPAS